jgi:hypothetical protein
MEQFGFLNLVTFVSIIFGNIHLSKAFIPDALAGISSLSSTFHTEMTERALIRHAMSFFDDYRAKGDPPLEEALGQNPTATEVFEAFYEQSPDTDSFLDALDQLKDACASIDHNKDTKSNPKWHFDAERFEEGKANLLAGMKRILLYIQASEFDTARETLGQIFHPLQDFYSHSNYVELGQRQIMPELISEAEPLPLRIAGPEEQTCQDCSRTASERLRSALLKLTIIAPIGLGALGGDEDNIYDCESNLVKGDFLTSGYYVNQYDDEGREVPKPPGIGKCSHGGALDGTAGQYATGGINKDMENSLFAAHHYLHKEAAILGEEATLHLLNTMRKKLGDDTKWARFLQLAPGPSLAFVVDVCPGMKPYISLIKSKIKEAVEKSLANSVTDRQFIIVPFTDRLVGDPDIGTTVEDLDKAFDRSFNFYDKTDCGPNRKLYEATQKAALKSNVGGYIYATTEGRPWDSHLAPWVEATMNQKQLIFQLVLTSQIPKIQTADPSSDSRSDGPPRDLVLSNLRQLALANSGDVVNIGTEDAGSIINYRTGLRGVGTVLLVASGKKSQRLNLLVDDSISDLEVSIISGASGHPPNINLLDPRGRLVLRQTSEEVASFFNHNQSHYHVIRTMQPLSGTWKIAITTNESSNPTADYKVVATGITRLTMRTQFRKLSVDGRTTHLGQEAIGRTRPAANTKLYVAIRPSGHNGSATPVYVQLRSADWTVISQAAAEPSPARRNQFVAEISVPSKPFYLRIYGFNSNGEPFGRTNPRIISPSTVSIAITEAPRKLTESDPTGGSGFKLSFTVVNQANTALFYIKAHDTKGYLKSYQPKGVILRRGGRVTGSILISIPPNSTAPVTDVTIIASNGKSENTNTLSKFVGLA